MANWRPFGHCLSFDLFPPARVLTCKRGTSASPCEASPSSGLLRKHKPLWGLREPWAVSFHGDSHPGPLWGLSSGGRSRSSWWQWPTSGATETTKGNVPVGGPQGTGISLSSEEWKLKVQWRYNGSSPQRGNEGKRQTSSNTEMG